MTFHFVYVLLEEKLSLQTLFVYGNLNKCELGHLSSGIELASTQSHHPEPFPAAKNYRLFMSKVQTI